MCVRLSLLNLLVCLSFLLEQDTSAKSYSLKMLPSQFCTRPTKERIRANRKKRIQHVELNILLFMCTHTHFMFVNEWSHRWLGCISYILLLALFFQKRKKKRKAFMRCQARISCEMAICMYVCLRVCVCLTCLPFYYHISIAI